MKGCDAPGSDSIPHADKVRTTADKMVLTRGQVVRAAIIAGVGAPLIRTLGHTMRWYVDGLEHHEAILARGRQPIFAFWHGRILAATYYWRNRGIVVMTSQNFDGEWIAQIIKRFGYGTARGSTSRGAKRALIQLRREVKAGRPVAFTVDGPRGPARRVQPGAVWLAGVTGNPILPFHIEADHYWSADSWDRTQIPRPFSHNYIAIGAPFEVPDPSRDGVLAKYQIALEQELSKLANRAAEWSTSHDG
tara:strand:- start:64 stop:807 length:744 start_codon:yes stop_codon:yes gene_type:complete